MISKSIPTFALGRLPLLLVEERQSLRDLEEHVEGLLEELRETQALLEVLDSLDHVDGKIIEQVRELRDLCFDVELAIERFAPTGGIKRFLGKGNVVKLIKSLRNKISDLNARVQECRIERTKTEESSRGQSMNRPTNISTVFEEDSFVGRESDIQRLVSVLQAEEKRKVISIYGMGGLGKTTLAKKLYHHPDVCSHFERFSFIYISQKFEISSVLKQILWKLSPNQQYRIPTLSKKEVHDKLRKVLTKKKCLLVLDDIWTSEAWNDLKPALLVDDAKSRSKVLITSRNGGIVDTGGFCYPLQGLSDEDSWKLLSKRILSERDASDSSYKEFEKIGKELLQWCKGLPVAIQVLGGLLVTKHTLGEWKRVQERLNSEPKCEEFSNLHEEVARILSLSYTDLPYKLKPCFLYCATFRFMMDHDTHNQAPFMFKLIGEGLVLPQDRQEGETIIHVAKRYIKELRIRSMVQYFDEGAELWDIHVELHDLMHELCSLKAIEDKFLSFSSIEDEHELINRDPHRLCVDMGDNVGKETKRVGKGKSLKSVSLGFVCQKPNYDIWKGRPVKFLSDEVTMFCEPLKCLSASEFRSIKVLYIHGLTWDGKNLIDLHGTSNLLHLRCLCVKNCEGLIVSSSLVKLHYLEYLIFEKCRDIYMLGNWWCLKRLVYLVLPEESARTSQMNLNGMSRLEILDNYNPSSDGELSGIRNLVYLGASVEDLGQFQQLLWKLHNAKLNPLPNLTLSVTLASISDLEYVMSHFSSLSNLYSLAIKGPISNLLLDNICFLENLHILYLTSSKLQDKDSLEALQTLPKLAHLSLSDHAFTGEEIVFQAAWFPQLKSLSLVLLPDIRRLTIEQHAMPNLHKLEILHCRMLEMIPEGLVYIQSLQELWIADMPQGFVDRLQTTTAKEGQDVYKVHHVPLIKIL